MTATLSLPEADAGGRAASPLPFHDARERLFNELHTRPFPVLENGTRVSQLALLHGGAEVAAEYAHLSLLCARISRASA